MKNILFGVLAAFALVAATPAFACDGDCHKKKEQVAQAEKKGDTKDAPKVGCTCAGEGKECKCAEGCKCACSHCHKDAKKDEKKTT